MNHKNDINDMTLLYKALKYIKKSGNNVLLDKIKNNNILNLYYLAKNTYVKTQKGGFILNTEQLENTKLKHLSFHGTIAGNKKLIVPDEMHLIIPLCCGFTNKGSYVEYDFYAKSESEIKNIVNNSTDLLQIGIYDYIVLRPGNIYCDIRIEIYIDININEGISTISQTAEFLKNHYIDNQHEIIYTFSITQDDIDVLYYLLKNKSYKVSNITNLHLLKSKIQYTDQFYDKMNNLIINCMFDESFELFKIQYVERIHEMLNLLHTTFSNDADVMLKIAKFSNAINHVIETSNENNLFENISELFDLLYNDNIYFYDILDKATKIKILRIVGSCENDLHTNIILSKEMRKQMRSIMLNNENILQFIKKLKPEKLSLAENAKYLFFSKYSNCNLNFISDASTLLFDETKFIELLSNIYVCHYGISKMCEQEKNFIRYMMKEKEYYVDVLLSDLLNFLKMNESGNLFIFNNSCQSFSENLKVCQAGHCLALISDKIGLNISYTEIFDNENLIDLSNALDFIKSVDSTYFNEQIPEQFTNIQNQWSVFGNEWIISEIDKYKKILNAYDEKFDDEQKIIDIIKIYIIYVKNKFPRLYNVLIKNQNMILVERQYARIIITIINMFASEFYNNASIEHKHILKRIMGNTY